MIALRQILGFHSVQHAFNARHYHQLFLGVALDTVATTTFDTEHLSSTLDPGLGAVWGPDIATLFR